MNKKHTEKEMAIFIKRCIASFIIREINLKQQSSIIFTYQTGKKNYKV